MRDRSNFSEFLSAAQPVAPPVEAAAAATVVPSKASPTIAEKMAFYSTKPKCIQKSHVNYPKEPCISSKEPCNLPNYPCIQSKEPCIVSKEPTIESKESWVLN